MPSRGARVGVHVVDAAWLGLLVPLSDLEQLRRKVDCHDVRSEVRHMSSDPTLAAREVAYVPSG